ncbi:exported hypothetical protein [Candidatus Sulfotelmatobacter kueseliae]|uniref:Uncharacterized protein n=1 Tax=Candidatus Sulfotelmatobacter kueseliae TaxID=2042962 RepID=A0A2U3JW55_9BACT|nr:exported hypothetical protein [Candidatus Sulfotelmatobacter kueseliae]
MKHSRAGLIVLTAILGCAAYYRSWWLVMTAFFVFVVEYMAQEFSDIQRRFNRVEDKLDALSRQH